VLEWSWDRFICSGATPTTPNDAPQQTSSNYKTKKQGPLPLLLPERQAEREGANAHVGGDGIWPQLLGERSRAKQFAWDKSMGSCSLSVWLWIKAWYVRALI
jgi:hypothetical protein